MRCTQYRFTALQYGKIPITNPERAVDYCFCNGVASDWDGSHRFYGWEKKTNVHDEKDITENQISVSEISLRLWQGRWNP